ncbi:hypothetical protein M9Y10_027800 [Tritrichomonas musculus]|uniref:VWFA domain-containing protein n=1 Tax=Tritrichomonas musculus TaxID=1915356 RepID=A0ABR2H554_9EUKA
MSKLMKSLRPTTTPLDKIKFHYQDNTIEKPKKYIKVYPKDRTIFNFMQNILPNSPSMYDVYVNGKLLTDLSQTLESIQDNLNPSIFLTFESKKIEIKLFSTRYPKGEDLSFLSNVNKESFFNDKLKIDEDDYFIIYDSNGSNVEISDDNCVEEIESGKTYYLISYPKYLKYDPKTEMNIYINNIFDFLKIELPQFSQLLSIFYLLKEDIKLKEKIFEKLKNKEYHPVDFVIKSEINYIDINLIMSLFFIKENDEDYIQLFNRLLKRAQINVFDSKLFVITKNVKIGTIISFDNKSYGVFKKFNDNENSYEYFDPYKNESITSSIGYSDIDNPDQITAIYIDTSGTMRIPFDSDGRKRYEAAEKIANLIIHNVRDNSIYDPLICFTKCKISNDQFPLKFKKDEIKGKTNIWDSLDDIIGYIIDDKYPENCPRRIVIISDGEDTISTAKREDVLKKIQKYNIIVDSIILCKDENAEDPYKFSIYTNGVYMFTDDLKSALKFVSLDPFYDLGLRKPLIKKSIPNEPFDNEQSEDNYQMYTKVKNFVQFDPINDPHQFYVDFENGLLKPSLKKLDENDQNIILRELFECLSSEGDGNFYTFLIKDNDNEEMFKHWCVFIKMDNKEDASYYWQLKIDFDSYYPFTTPKMRIISHPELIINKEQYISDYGTIKNKEVWDSSVLKSLRKIIEIAKKFKFKEFEYNYDNSPVSVINKSLSMIINVLFEDD